MDSVAPMSNDLPVYVVHWNAPEWVKSTTDAFLASTIATRVTVIDNGPDDTPLALDVRVRVVRSGANLGYAGGANLGIAEWLAGDAELCVDRVSRRTARTRRVGAARRRGRRVARVRRHRPGSGRQRRVWAVLATTARVTDVAWASGTCLLLRRTCIEVVGGFDVEFGSYGEDVDLCYRAREAGWKVGCIRGVRVKGVGSVDHGFRTQMYVNQVRMRAKHAGSRQSGEDARRVPRAGRRRRVSLARATRSRVAPTGGRAGAGGPRARRVCSGIASACSPD